jgi:transposase
MVNEVSSMTNQFQMGNNRAAKLTGEQVVEILERYATETGLSQSMLAREYGVGLNTISKIVNGTSWTHITRPGQAPGQQAAKVFRPPLQPTIQRPVTQFTAEDIAAAEIRIKERAAALNAAKPKPPSLYDSPPPTLAEDEAAGSLGMSRLQRELDGAKPTTQQQANDGLDQLEKGD